MNDDDHVAPGPVVVSSENATEAADEGLREDLDQRRVCALINKFSKCTIDRHTVEDLSQDVLLKAHATYAPVSGRWWTWVALLARQKVAEHARGTGGRLRRHEALAEGLLSREDAPDQAELDREATARIVELLSTFSVRTQQIWYARAVNEASVEQIAWQFNTTKAAVYQAYFKVNSALRAALAE